MPPIIPKKRNILFGSNKQYGQNTIPYKTQIIKAFLKDPPKKKGEYKKYKIREGLLAVLKKEKINSYEYTDYYKLTIVKDGTHKSYFVKEVNNKTLLKTLNITGYNEFYALNNKLLRKELEKHGLKVINVFYGFEHKATERNFVVTEYMDPSKYETIDNMYISKKITKEKYKEYRLKFKNVFDKLREKGFNVSDIGTHNLFINKHNPQEIIIFDIMLDIKNSSKK